MDGALVREVRFQELLELGPRAGGVALLQRQHRHRIDDVGIVGRVLEQAVELGPGRVVIALADQQAGQGQAGIAGIRLARQKLVETLDRAGRRGAGQQLGVGEFGAFPVGALLQRLVEFALRAHQVVGIGCRETHREMRFRQFVIRRCDAIDQALHGLLVAVPVQHAVQVHQVAGDIGLVLFEQAGELRGQVVKAVGEQQQCRFGLARLA